MKDYRRILHLERKPTASGNQKAAVGGELLPVNLAQLVAANILWVVLLFAPIIIVYLMAKRGIKIPTAVRYLFRLIPIVARATA